MKTPSKEQLENTRAEFPPGTRVELPNGMDDEYSPIPAGTRGTVVGIDDMINLMVKWDNGSTLNAIVGHDCIRRVPSLSPKAVEGLLAVRDTARTNMFDLNAVAAIANELGFYETVVACADEKKLVAHFILTGETELQEWKNVRAFM